MVKSSRLNLWLGHAAYLIVLAIFTVSLPEDLFNPESRDYILIIGYIALWRYSFWGLNLARFLIYVRGVFPKWRSQIEERGAELLPSEVYLLVTSFRVNTETSRRVYGSCFEEAIDFSKQHNVPVTIVSSIVEKSDEVLIKQLFSSYKTDANVKIIFTRIAGTGKRDGLSYGFRAISKQAPAADSVVAVIDGDSLLDPGLLEKCTPLFKLHPKLGGLTTDEVCQVEGNNTFKNWYSMRFAQRHIYMSSVSLSRRVLTLTGRMSMFRADIICDPEFVRRVELDWVDHWRLKRFKFLTGDDKSSWYHLLKEKYEMLYVPDVKVLTIETPPDPSFRRSSIMLMRRWFGNMLRTSDRAIRLGPSTCNWFPWISIIDQRLSMWTSLTGLTVTIIAWLAGVEYALLFYIYWMFLTRYIITLTYLFSRPYISATYPFLLYYNQIVGSLVKTYVLFRLDKQKWTRQNTTLATDKTRWQQRFTNMGSFYMNCFAYCLFIAVLANISNILTMPDIHYWTYIIKG